MPDPENNPALKGATPADMEAIRRGLDRLDVEPSGIARAYRDRRIDADVHRAMTMSCRCDQESLHDSNLIRQALKRAQAAEKEIKRLNAIKVGLMLMLPGCFFMGMMFTMFVIEVIGGKGASLLIPFCFGTAVGFLFIIGSSTLAVGRTILLRVHESFSKGLFD